MSQNRRQGHGHHGTIHGATWVNADGSPIEQRHLDDQSQDREIAEWVLKAGGRVGVGKNAGGVIRDLSDLPASPIILFSFSVDGSTELTDEVLQSWNPSPFLSQVVIRNCNVTHQGLTSLESWKNLTQLALTDLPIDDRALTCLHSMNKLMHLNLSNTKKPDKAVTHISRLKKMRNLVIKGTGITAKGVEELRQALPESEIIWDGGVIAPRGNQP